MPSIENYLFDHLEAQALTGGAIADPSKAGDIPGWLAVATAGAYVLPAVYVVSLFVRRGRTPYDWISGSTVIQ